MYHLKHPNSAKQTRNHRTTFTAAEDDNAFLDHNQIQTRGNSTSKKRYFRTSTVTHRSHMKVWASKSSTANSQMGLHVAFNSIHYQIHILHTFVVVQ
jgi:hypothetical protein